MTKTFKEFLEEAVSNQDIIKWTKKIQDQLDADTDAKEIHNMLKQINCPKEIADKVVTNLGR
jgi:hypothetical protein